jgi:hypothetical protein
MPSKEQMELTRLHIEDVTGRRYIEGDGDMCGCRYAPEGGGIVGDAYCVPPEPGEAVPFSSLDETSKVELLTTYVSWEGFDFAQDGIVIRNVLDGKAPAKWMDGINQETLGAELEADAYAARKRDYGADDAATYARRVAEGAATVRHLDGPRAKAANQESAGQAASKPIAPLAAAPRIASLISDNYFSRPAIIRIPGP